MESAFTGSALKAKYLAVEAEHGRLPSNLQASKSVVLDASDLVAGQVENPEVLQTPKHIRSDEVDEVAIEGQL